MSIFFTSDTHFWHNGALRFREGFGSVEQMNEALIGAWNDVVRMGDTVYHLGDLSFAGLARTQEVVDMLNGTMHIVPGNHDDKTLLARLRTNDGPVIVEPPLMDLKLQFEGEPCRFTLCHFPLLQWNRAQHGAIHLHGHSHGSCRYPNPENRILDVGVDSWSPSRYEPLSLQRVLWLMASRTYAGADHHKEKAA